MKQSPAMKKQVRKIQYWLSKEEHQSGFGFKLYSSGLYDQYGRLLGLSRNGVVVVHGGACVIEPWKSFKTSQIKRLFDASKKRQQSAVLAHVS